MPILWLIKNWRISLYAALFLLIIGAYFKGRHDEKMAINNTSLQEVVKIREKFDAIRNNPPDESAVIERLHKHKF